MFSFWRPLIDVSAEQIAQFVTGKSVHPNQNPRRAELEKYWSYYDGRQYGRLKYNWDGETVEVVSRDPNAPPSGASLIPAAVGAGGWYVPMRARRPSTTRDIAREIVNGFTSLLFGEGSVPKFRIGGMDEAQGAVVSEWLDRWAESAGLGSAAIEARNIGGATGTAVVVLGIGAHGFTLDVFSPQDCRPIFNERRSATLAAVEVRMTTETDFVNEDGENEHGLAWYRRVVSEQSDVTYKPHPVYRLERVVRDGKEQGRRRSDNPYAEDEITWQEAHRIDHGLGVCPAVWIRNLPNGSDVYGLSDYSGQLEKIDQVNRLDSAGDKALFATMDPTLILGLSPDDLKGNTVTRGVSTAILVGKGGTASYLEISGKGLEISMTRADKLEANVYSACQYVKLDPEKVTVGLHSSPALRMVYGKMLDRGTILRAQYGQGMISRLAEIALAMAGKASVIVKAPAEILPPILRDAPLLPPGSAIGLTWGEWFQPSPDDVQKIVQTATQAVGNEKVISVQTAREQILSKVIKVNESEERARLEREGAASVGRFADFVNPPPDIPD